MLDVIFVLLAFFAIILMLYSIMERNIAFCMITAVLFLILALFTIQGVEIPYQMFNATSGNIETGTQVIQNNLTPLSYLFSGLASIMIILVITFSLEYLTDFKRMKK